MSATVRAGALGVVAALGVCACSSGLEVALPALASDPACAAASASWPGTVSTAQPTPVRAPSPAVRAWGDPAIIARCGVDPLAPTTLDCVTVDGVDWVVEPLSDGARFTTYGRNPAIEVLIPAAYAPEPLLLPAFGAAAAALPHNGRRCA